MKEPDARIKAEVAESLAPLESLIESMWEKLDELETERIAQTPEPPTPAP
jgi:hypothetical protein